MWRSSCVYITIFFSPLTLMAAGFYADLRVQNSESATVFSMTAVYSNDDSYFLIGKQN